MTKDYRLTEDDTFSISIYKAKGDLSLQFGYEDLSTDGKIDPASIKFTGLIEALSQVVLMLAMEGFKVQETVEARSMAGFAILRGLQQLCAEIAQEFHVENNARLAAKADGIHELERMFTAKISSDHLSGELEVTPSPADE